MKPIIGVTTVTHRYERGTITKVSTNFANAISKGGAVPLHIPILKTKEQAREILSVIDALVISGGDESVHPNVLRPTLLKAPCLLLSRA
ncbi:gamma-glutamyl-gamma-aminobutyrate hydrolase family protein [Photobacterium swingsii]|uniref:gamma-glutamyl-gamma-aminobutyrate hydrolase family protein n=1 Tax=Photobacterium swingsii TaxID=680026 RepID=UPI003552F7FC